MTEDDLLHDLDVMIAKEEGRVEALREVYQLVVQHCNDGSSPASSAPAAKTTVAPSSWSVGKRLPSQST